MSLYFNTFCVLVSRLPILLFSVNFQLFLLISFNFSLDWITMCPLISVFDSSILHFFKPNWLLISIFFLIKPSINFSIYFKIILELQISFTLSKIKSNWRLFFLNCWLKPWSWLKNSKTLFLVVIINYWSNLNPNYFFCYFYICFVFFFHFCIFYDFQDFFNTHKLNNNKENKEMININ